MIKVNRFPHNKMQEVGWKSQMVTIDEKLQYKRVLIRCQLKFLNSDLVLVDII